MNQNNSNKNQFNEDLKLLNDYPFQRLNNLLKNIHVPSNKKPLILSIGEPQHKPPKLLKK